MFVYLVEKYPDHFSDLFYALDIWHKTIKLTKKLAKVSRGSIKPLFFTSHYFTSDFYVSQAAKVKGCEAINQWSEPIRNHFWHVAEHCNGDAEVLKVRFNLIL